MGIASSGASPRYDNDCGINALPPMHVPPPGIVLHETRWYPHQSNADDHPFPIYVMFMTVGRDRRVLASSTDADGYWYQLEYRLRWDAERQDWFAHAQRRPDGLDVDELISAIGDPVDAWILYASLPPAGAAAAAPVGGSPL